MYSPPLHRKLLPWLYTLVFLITAPLVIFYTAGYRYNLKKAAIEKHGTLILDSTPRDATIFLNGEKSSETTPTTVQKLSPGWHTIRFEREGYTPWEKAIEIRAERVSFANAVYLWRTSPTTQLLATGDYSALVSNPEADTVAAVRSHATGSRVELWQSRGRQSTELALTASSTLLTSIRWQEDSRAFVLDRPAPAEDTLVRLQNRDLVATSTLLDGVWDGTVYSAVESSSETRQPLAHTNIQWNSRTGAVERTSISTSTTAVYQSLRLESQGTDASLILERTFRDRSIPLSRPDWTFRDSPMSDWVFLTQGDRWLALNPYSEQPIQHEIRASHVLWSPNTVRPPQGLFVGTNELHLWTPEGPTLLLRQTTPLVAASWHRSGTIVFLATATTIEALELDARDGRYRTHLATFDAIRSMATVGPYLYVAGTRDGVTGLWMLTIE